MAYKKVKILSLPKAQYGLNQNFDTSYDTSKSYAENLELNKRAQAMGWNSVADYQKSNWGKNPRPGFGYQPDASIPQGPQLAAPQLQNVQRNIAASKPNAPVSVPQEVRQQRATAGQPNPAYEKSSVGPTKVNAGIANENAALKAQREEKNRQEIEYYKNRSVSDMDPAGLPSVPIFEAAFMAPVALSSLGAAATTLGETSAAFEAIPEVSGALRAKGAYDFGNKVVPETIKSFKDYNRTGNTDQLAAGLGNIASTGIKTFSGFGPWQTGAKQIGKYYGIGTNAYNTAAAEDSQGFAKSAYNTFTGAIGLKPKKQEGGDMPFGLPLKEQNIYTLPEYNQPRNPRTGEILPDPRRPNLGMGTGATEYKATVGYDEGDVDIPMIVSGQYVGPQGATDRYELTGERFKTMTDPGSYSKFYDQIKRLGLMQEKYGGSLKRVKIDSLPNNWKNK